MSCAAREALLSDREEAARRDGRRDSGAPALRELFVKCGSGCSRLLMVPRHAVNRLAPGAWGLEEGRPAISCGRAYRGRGVGELSSGELAV